MRIGRLLNLYFWQKTWFYFNVFKPWNWSFIIKQRGQQTLSWKGTSCGHSISTDQLLHSVCISPSSNNNQCLSGFQLPQHDQVQHHPELNPEVSGSSPDNNCQLWNNSRSTDAICQNCSTENYSNITKTFLFVVKWK